MSLEVWLCNFSKTILQSSTTLTNVWKFEWTKITTFVFFLKNQRWGKIQKKIHIKILLHFFLQTNTTNITFSGVFLHPPMSACSFLKQILLDNFIINLALKAFFQLIWFHLPISAENLLTEKKMPHWSKNYNRSRLVL